MTEMSGDFNFVIMSIDKSSKIRLSFFPVLEICQWTTQGQHPRHSSFFAPGGQLQYKHGVVAV